MPKRFSTVKGYFLEPVIGVNGNVSARYAKRSDARDYIFKIGKHADKAHTRISGVYEFGEFVDDGERTDLFYIIEDIEAGLPNMELSRKYGRKYIQYRSWADEYRQDFLRRKYKRERRLNMEVTYIYGVTETGKTRHVLDKYGDDNVFRMTDYGGKFTSERFDGYECEDIIVFEEFRSQIKIERMLNYLDVYAIELPSRFRNKWACYTKVYILSNWKLEEQYINIQKEHPETWKAFRRRIKFNFDFDASKIAPVSKYMLKPLPDNEQIPSGF